jgi:peptide/nickel transport system substrate-binding protein
MRSPSNRWLFVLVLVAGLAAFSGLWYATSTTSSSREPEHGGTYVEGMAGAPSRVNPLFASQNAVDESLVALVFAGLTRLDDQGRPFPDLAETWSISPDGREYVFVLRPGLVWHDGAPLTANDVAFTYSQLRTPGLRTNATLQRVLTGVEVRALDEARVSFRLPERFAPLPAYLTLGILPSHLLGASAGLFDDAFNQQPIGAGAYRLQELTPEHAVLEASPAHHFGHPFIQRIELRFFANEGLVLAALRDGDVDGGLFNGIAAREALTTEQRVDLQLLTLAVPEVTCVYLNLDLPLFSDRRVRQALLLASDRDAIVDEVLRGQAQRADSPLAPGSWAYDSLLDRYGHDPAVASLLLDEAGWRLTDAGVRTRAGQELSFRLATNSDPVRLAVAQRLADSWTALGIGVTIDAMAATTLVREVLEPRSFEAALFSAPGEADPDPYLLWHSSQDTGKGLNLASLEDRRFDTLIEQARLEGSPPRREELYGQFQELFAQELPALPLFAETLLYVQPESLKGARVGYAADAGARFWQVQEWHLRTR